MKAIRVHEAGGPEVMKLEEAPDPSPGPGEVVVSARAIGVNPVDTYIRSGNYRGVSFPYTPGSDAAGIVEAVGEGASRFQPGDRVYTFGSVTGAYAEKLLCKESQVHPLPDRLSFSQGAAIGVPYGTAYRALYQRAHALPSEHVLIHGASGGVGSAAVQIARAGGMTVYGTGGTEEGRELVRKEGAHQVFDHHAPDYMDRIKEATGGTGLNVILEMLANVNLQRDLEALAQGGRVVVIGNRGSIEINPRETMRGDLAVLGMLLFNATEEELKQVHAALYAGFENGSLKPIVGQEIPLAEAPRAHEAVMASGAYGKIVLIP